MAIIDAPSVSVTLNGASQTAANTFAINVTDIRVVNDGWRLQVSSTQLSTGGATQRRSS